MSLEHGICRGDGAGSHDDGARAAHATERRRNNARSLKLAVAITFVFVVVELIGGLISGSLALVADAGHMVSDLAALLLALFALHIAERQATVHKTYGYVRTEILAALANGVALLLVCIYVISEAVGRLLDPPEVQTELMLGVAVLGLLANLAAAFVLFRGRGDSLNMRGAFLHVVGDTLGSVGAIVAALVMSLFGWDWADGVAAIAIAGLILISAWGLLRESVEILMESTPKHVDLPELGAAIRKVDGVVDIHDLHVWTLTSGYFALSAHVDVRSDSNVSQVLKALEQLAQEAFNISHTTFQLEPAAPLLQIESHPE
jgi:cobalt-zinc-cadmium efflux system protein